MITRRQFLVTAQAGGFLAATGWSLVIDQPLPEYRRPEGGLRVHIVLEGGLDTLSVVYPMAAPALRRLRPSFAPLYGDGLALGQGWAFTSLLPSFYQHYADGQVSINVMIVPTQPSHMSGLIAMREKIVANCEIPPFVVAPAGTCSANWEASMRLRTEDQTLGSLTQQLMCDIVAETRSDTLIVAFAGFDWHSAGAPLARTWLPRINHVFSAAVTALKKTGRWDNSTVEVRSELSRGLSENWRGGVDHGGIGLTLVAGGANTGGLFASDAVRHLLD